MDPNNIPTPSFDLPRPASTEAGQFDNGGQSETSGQTEQRNMEMPGSTPPAPVVSAPPAQVPPTQTTPAPPAPAAQTAASQQQMMDELEAADSDLIEKAWIQKAKAIVEHTKADPHVQNKEINKVKSEYIKKRYNKDIKLNDEQTAWQPFWSSYLCCWLSWW